MLRNFTKHCKASPTPSRGGFTLVELLVVVSIIALLIAILLPSLRKAQEQAKLATCLANLAGLAKASLTYAADDPGENMIPVPDLRILEKGAGTIEWGGKSGIGQPTSEGDPALSVFGTSRWKGPAHRPLNPMLYKAGFNNYYPVGGIQNPGPGNRNYLADTKLDLGEYRCPSDTGFTGGRFRYNRADGDAEHVRNEKRWRDDGPYTAYDHYGNSYSVPTSWIIGGLAGLRIRSMSVYLQPHSRIPSPSTSVTYLEMPARFAWVWGDWNRDPYTGQPANWMGGGCQDYGAWVDDKFAPIPGWHRENYKFTTAFADGHASAVFMKGCYRASPNLGIDNYPAGGCGTSVDPYQCFQCVVVRGPGWQLDVLPASDVLTPWFSDGY